MDEKFRQRCRHKPESNNFVDETFRQHSHASGDVFATPANAQWCDGPSALNAQRAASTWEAKRDVCIYIYIHIPRFDLICAYSRARVWFKIESNLPNPVVADLSPDHVSSPLFDGHTSQFHTFGQTQNHTVGELYPQSYLHYIPINHPLNPHETSQIGSIDR